MSRFALLELSAILLVLATCAAPSPQQTSPTPRPKLTDSPAPLGLPGGNNAISCVLQGDDWPSETTDVRLRFRPSGPSFAKIGKANHVDLILPADLSQGGALARVHFDGVRLAGVINLADVHVFPARPFLIGGFLLPLPYARLGIVGAEPDLVDVSVVVPEVSGTATHELRPCADLSVTGHRFDPIRAVSGGMDTSSATLRKGRGAALGLHPGGPRVITFTPGDVSVDVLERKGDETRIAAWSGQALVVGWVANAELLQPSIAPARDLIPSLVLSGSGHSEFGAHLTCGVRVPLVAELAGERRTVGHVEPGVPVDRGPEFDGYAEVELPSAAMMVDHEAKLLAPLSVLSACAAVEK